MSTMIAPTIEPRSPAAEISKLPPKISAARVPPTNEPMTPRMSVPSQPIGSGPGTRARAMNPATSPMIRVLLVPVDCQFIPAFSCDATPAHLVSFSPTENFTTYFRVALFGGIALAMPVLLYEIYAYIDPALLPKERRFIRFMGLPVIFLFVVGMLFCYFVLLPNAIKFLITFGSEVITNQLRAADYLSFVTVFILGMGVVFEVPVVIFSLVKIHVLTRAVLA